MGPVPAVALSHYDDSWYGDYTARAQRSLRSDLTDRKPVPSVVPDQIPARRGHVLALYLEMGKAVCAIRPAAGSISLFEPVAHVLEVAVAHRVVSAAIPMMLS